MTQLTPEEIWNAYQEAERKRTAGTGGPASGGLTVRDYFAAQAMQGLIASPRLPAVRDEDGDITDAGIAGLSYKIADAMLTERNK